MGKAPRPLEAALGVGPRELVALVGGGGKTSLMYRLGGELVGSGRRAAAATTTRIAAPCPEDGAELLCADACDSLAQGLRVRPGLSVLGRELSEEGKVRGIPAEWCDRLFEEGAVDVLVVEADGSRRLPLKAPGDREPVVPAATTLFVAVIGLSCLGRPLGDEVAFRPERVEAATGCPLGVTISPDLLARLLTAPEGLLKGRPPGARAAAFLNQADDAAAATAAREVAGAVLGRENPWERVVVGRLRSSEPVVEVWLR